MKRNIWISGCAFVLFGCLLALFCVKNTPETPQNPTQKADIQEITFEEAIDFFEQKQTGVLYFGFKDCPWCQCARPILEKVAIENDQTIYYVKTRKADKNHTRLYDDTQKERIRPYIEKYMEDNEEGELTLYVPLVLQVQEGVVKDGHMGTITNHDATQRKLNDAEKEELEEIYEDLMDFDKKESVHADH